MEQAVSKYAKGYLTVAMALSLTVLLSLVMVLIEGARQNTVRLQSNLVMDLALNSVFAEYNRELLERYELFFIDTSYGGSNPDIHNASEHLKDYMEKNIQTGLGVDMEVEGIGIDEFAFASDMEGEIFYNQVMDYMEHNYGITLAEDIAESMKIVKDNRWDTEESSLKREENQKILDNEPTPQKKTIYSEYNEETGKIEEVEKAEDVPIENPADGTNELRGKGLLNLVVEEPSKLSGAAVGTDSLISHRKDCLIGQGDWEEGKNSISELTDSFLYDRYLFDKCSYYGKEKEDAFLKYEMEYILCGKERDIDNLKGVVNRLLILREAANAAYLYSDSTKMTEIQAMAAAVAAVAVAPHLQVLLEVAILFAWAFIESLQDVRLLLSGGKIPLMKDSSEWRTGLKSILEKTPELQDGATERGLDYAGYLQIFLALQNRQEKIFRTMDVIEVNIRRTLYNENFRMDGCLSAMLVNAGFSSGRLKYKVRMKYSY